MTSTLPIILPVFLLVIAGWLARWRRLMEDGHVDGLMRFAQSFAVPCLLFRGISRLDLAAHFDAALLISFYGGALICFALGMAGARFIFGRSDEDSVAIGFCALFSNSLLLGLPIMERAYGAGAVQGNYAIIAIHAPMLLGLGITVMEFTRARRAGTSLRRLPAKVAAAMFRNALVIGIALGAAVNLTHLPLPEVLEDGLDLITRAALPTALFALGGILYRYRPEGDARVIGMVTLLSLVVHPALAWGLGTALGLGADNFRSLIVTASMAPGINAYLFASIYGTAKRVAASAVLISTAVSILTASVWISLLP